MAAAPTPDEIFHHAVDEGQRRLDQSLLELTSTSFIAGFTIVFGIIGLGIAHAAVEPLHSGIARLVGALAFAVGVVFLVVGRAELFTENFFDPVATAFARHERGILLRIARLWGITFALNLVGGALLALLIAIPGVLPPGTDEALSKAAEEIARRGPWAALASAILGGALVALLSFLLLASDGTGSRIAVAYFIGVLLAIGPFDHAIVTALHVLLGILFGVPLGFGALAEIIAIATAGNLIGGVGLVTLSHAAQAKGAEEAA
jgi:formate/nitrite transporter FocA (FNT family)